MDWFNWLFGRRKPLTTPSSNRIVVGECEVCHKPIRVKAHAVRTEMRLTCKCGHVNTIKKPRNDAEILSLLRQLCNAYANNDTNLIEKLEPLATKIGKELDQHGGIEEMRRIWYQLGNIRGARTLEMHWSGIGDWRG